MKYLEIVSIVQDKRLPPEGKYVLVWDGNWDIAKLEVGISVGLRNEIINGALPDHSEVLWSQTTGNQKVQRSKIYKACDEGWNNTVPYCWYRKNGSTILGQNVTHWTYLPDDPTKKE